MGCSSGSACTSGICDLGICVECTRLGSGCSENQYCDLGTCKSKLGFGSFCLTNSACLSNVCDGTCTTTSCIGYYCPFGETRGACGKTKCCKIKRVCIPWGGCHGGGTNCGLC